MSLKVNGVKIAGYGAPGKDGEPGKSAYEYAKEGGYAGTEDEFRELMAGPIPVEHGGTGARNANDGRRNLGAAAVLEMTQAEYDALPTIDPTIFYALTDVEAGGVKIEVGSYVGTGTGGSGNPTVLTFGFKPKFVFIVRDTAGGSFTRAQFLALAYGQVYSNGIWWSSSGDYYPYLTITWGEKSVSFHSASKSSYQAENQMNHSGHKYYTLAIG